MFSAVAGIGEHLIEAINTGRKLETCALCNRYICDVIGSVAFGLDCKALTSDKSELLEIGEKVFHISGLETLRFFFVNSFMGLSRSLKLKSVKPEYSSFFIETVRQAIEYRETNNVKRNDFLNSLIQLKNTGTIDGEKIDNDKKLTFNQIVAEAFLFFFAG